nr:hypothetical protein [Providencia rettgeri]
MPAIPEKKQSAISVPHSHFVYPNYIHIENKTKTKSLLLVSFTFPPFPIANSHRKKNKPGHPEFILDTPAPVESPRVA